MNSQGVLERTTSIFLKGESHLSNTSQSNRETKLEELNFPIPLAQANSLGNEFPRKSHSYDYLRKRKA